MAPAGRRTAIIGGGAPMSWLIAAVYQPFMRRAERRRVPPGRQQLLAALSGGVLEVGAGTGATLPYSPPTVQRLIVAEPDRAMRARLSRQLARGTAARGLP